MAKVCALLIFLFANCGYKNQEKLYVNFDIKLKEIDKKYYFVINGSTNLPDGAQIAVVLYHIYFLKEMPCEGYLDDKTLEIENKKFYATLGGYKRKPFSQNYRCLVKFDPKNQFENVKAAVKETDEFEKTVDISIGTSPEFESEISQVKVELKDDFAKIYAIFGEIKGAHTKSGIDEKIIEVERINDSRIGNWIMSLETQGKIYIGGLCDRLKEMLATKGDAKKKRELEEAFTDLYNEEIYALGFDTPIAAEKVSDCLKRIKGALATSSEDTFNSAVFELANILPERHLKLLTDLSEAFHNTDRQGVKATFAKLENEINNRR